MLAIPEAIPNMLSFYFNIFAFKVSWIIFWMLTSYDDACFNKYIMHDVMMWVQKMIKIS